MSRVDFVSDVFLTDVSVACSFWEINPETNFSFDRLN